MNEKLFDVFVTGNFFGDTTKDQAIAAFAKLFKVAESAAQTTFDKAPVSVKKNIDELTANKITAAFKKIGVESVVAAAGDGLQLPVDTEANEPGRETEVVADAATVVSPIVDVEEHLGLSFRIEGEPDYAFLSVEIPANQTLKVEASAMATMDVSIKMKTKLKGGFGRFLTGENIFINEFTAENVAGEIGIAPGTPGDLMHQYLDGNTIFLQNSAFVAATMSVDIETKWQGMVKGFFSGESLFLIRCSGNGDLWFNTYGAIIEIDVEGDYVVDTGNIVGFTEGLDYEVTKVGGYKSLFFSGEGFVCRFSGKGKVWIQTRSAAALTSWAHYFRPIKGKG